MNWTPEAVRAEMDYREEQARGGDPRTTADHLREARAKHPSWWRRVRTQHHQPKQAA